MHTVGYGWLGKAVWKRHSHLGLQVSLISPDLHAAHKKENDTTFTWLQGSHSPAYCFLSVSKLSESPGPSLLTSQTSQGRLAAGLNP